MPIQKFRSLTETRSTLYVLPETEEHLLALRSVFWIAACFAPRHIYLPGVHKYRTLADAQAARHAWIKSRTTIG